ncbi:hypothetical protein GWI33_018711, partial [Rhynchophorus ferrugineus]
VGLNAVVFVRVYNKSHSTATTRTHTSLISGSENESSHSRNTMSVLREEFRTGKARPDEGDREALEGEEEEEEEEE